MKTATVILAAGKGTRMKSTLPKVLHPVANKPMLEHVIQTALAINPEPPVVVIGHGAESIRKTITADKPIFVEQTEQLGTGHAVMQALPELQGKDKALVLYGDVPLIREETLQELLTIARDATVSILTAHMDNPRGYGRIKRNDANCVIGIVEEKDASEREKAIQETNTGIMVVDVDFLNECLPRLSNANSQEEYYLTDIVEMAVNQGKPVKTLMIHDPDEVAGANNRSQLAALERVYQRRMAEKLMELGVSLADPGRIDIRGEITTGEDVWIDVNCVLEGKVEMGSGVVIEPNCIIRNCTIGDGVKIRANSCLEEAVIEADCEVGPFARLRTGTLLRKKSKVGNFVETKKTELGEGSKANHLTYLGDSEIGKNVNIGAGTITCNYDGVNKHKTVLGDGVFIGSNCSLVAPVTIGENGTTGAGSVITQEVGDGQLAVSRARQKNIDGWKRPEKTKSKR